MASRIEDYGIIGDCHTVALVDRSGSIDWMCVPRFDSPACFAALLGTPENGRWKLAPVGEVRSVSRRYRDGTLILETLFETEGGAARVIDFMPLHEHVTDLVRVVEGVRGQVDMQMELIIRFDYGSVVPWVRRLEEGGIWAIAGPDTIRLRTDVELYGENLTTQANFRVAEGQRVSFFLTWYPSHEPPPCDHDPDRVLRETEDWWHSWSAQSTYNGGWREQVSRSLITLKALTYAPTGGIVAAATTSLPEKLGGVRNWDYRYCWLRDATFTLYSLTVAGYLDEARAWREWLLRAVAGQAPLMQIMYGIAGERRLWEAELPWLPGYEGAQPVRIGNAAAGQLQWDVYGEVIDAMFQYRRLGMEPDAPAWRLEQSLLEFLEAHWEAPDEGIWEVRGPRRDFTHSKVMVWVAFDRAVKSVEQFGLDGPLERWRSLRDAVHEQVCREGFDTELGSFVQSYGSNELDASLLLIPLVGFLPPEDPRVRGTLAAIERSLMKDGLIARYTNTTEVDGLPPGEGAFLACSFWFVDNLVLQGRYEEAQAMFERLLGLCNDVGLLAEEYDVHAKRQVGNFPQAFSHVSLVNSARNLSKGGGPAELRMAE